MTDWGGDYSLLIHSVEGRLSQYIEETPSHSVSSPMNRGDTVGGSTTVDSSVYLFPVRMLAAEVPLIGFGWPLNLTRQNS
jgi:hypothetical protein